MVGNQSKQKECLREAVTLLRPEEKIQAAHRHDYQGQLFELNGDYRSAARSYRKSSALWQQLGRERAVAVALLRVGCAQWEVGEKAPAVNNMTTALRMFIAQSNPFWETIAWLNAGGVLIREDPEQAFFRLKILLDEFPTGKSDLRLRVGLAFALQLLGDLEGADEQLHISEREHLDKHEMSGFLAVKLERAHVRLKMRDFLKARQLLECVWILRQSFSSSERQHHLSKLGRMYASVLILDEAYSEAEHVLHNIASDVRDSGSEIAQKEWCDLERLLRRRRQAS